MVINKAPITLCLEPITECILPRRKGAANVTQTAIMISMMSADSGRRLAAWAGPAARPSVRSWRTARPTGSSTVNEWQRACW